MVQYNAVDSGDIHTIIRRSATISYCEYRNLTFQGFSTGGILYPQGTFDSIWRHFWFLQLRGCYCHLVDSGQGCC